MGGNTKQGTFDDSPCSYPLAEGQKEPGIGFGGNLVRVVDPA